MKKTIPVILALLLLLGIFPFTAVANDPSDLKASIKAEQADVATRGDGEKIYKLVFSASTTNGIIGFTTIVSYDNTVIQPVDAESYTDIDITPVFEGDSFALTMLAKATNQDKEVDFLAAPEAWAVIGNRTAFKYGGYATDTAIAGEQEIFEFSFRVLEPSKLSKSTFRFENEWEEGKGFIFAFAKRYDVSYGSCLDDVIDGHLYYGRVDGELVDAIAVSLTYTGSDIATPLATPTVTVKQNPSGGLIVSIEDTANTKGVASYTIKITNAAGVSIEHTGEVKGDNFFTITDVPATGEPYTIEAKAVAATGTVYADSAYAAAPDTYLPQLTALGVAANTKVSNLKVGAEAAIELKAYITGGSGAYTFEKTAGDLPAGLSFADGKISGTPTATTTDVTLAFKVTDPRVTDPVTLYLTLSAIARGDTEFEYIFDGAEYAAKSVELTVGKDYTVSGTSRTVNIKFYEDVNGDPGDEIVPPTSAGTYWVGAAVVADTNYNALDEQFKQFTIKPAEVTLVWAPELFTYSGTNRAVSASYPLVGETGTSSALAFAYRGTSGEAAGDTEFCDAGEYTVTATLTDPNYTAKNPTMEYSIAPAEFDRPYDYPVTAEPTYDHGTKLKDITLTGGTVKFKDVAVSGSWAFTADGEIIPEAGGTTKYPAAFTPDSKPGNFTSLVYDVLPVISAAAYTGTVTGAVDFYYLSTEPGTFDITSLTFAPDLGWEDAEFDLSVEPVYSVDSDVFSKVEIRDPSTLVYTPCGCDVGNTTTVTVKVKGKNYKDSVDAVITFTAVELDIPWLGPEQYTLKENPVYGDIYGDIIRVGVDHLGPVVAVAGSGAVTGKFSVDTPRDIPDAGTTIAKLAFTVEGEGGKTYYKEYDIPSVAEKALTVTGLTANSREADGTTGVVLTGGALEGILRRDADKVTGVFPTEGTVATADVGNAKAVTFAPVTLEGKAAANYIVTQPTVTVDITPVVMPPVVLSFTGEASSKKVTLTWELKKDQSVGADIKEVIIKREVSGQKTDIVLKDADVPAGSYTDEDLINSTEYAYTMTFTNSAGKQTTTDTIVMKPRFIQPYSPPSSDPGGAEADDTSSEAYVTVTTQGDTVTLGMIEEEATNFVKNNTNEEGALVLDYSDNKNTNTFLLGDYLLAAASSTEKGTKPVTELVIKTSQDISLTMDKDTLTGFAKREKSTSEATSASDEPLRIEINRVTLDEVNLQQMKILKDFDLLSTVRISVSSGNTAIEELDGALRMTLPIEVKDGYDVSGIIGACMTDSGTVEELSGKLTTVKNTSYYEIKTTHLSVFTVLYDEARVWDNPYTDVKSGDWFYRDVWYGTVNGLMTGVNATEFAPGGISTRATVATVLWRLAGSPVVDSIIPFEDVEAGAWYCDAVRWATSVGVTNGVSENAFAPNDNVTREQFATMLHRFAQLQGMDVSVGEDTNILSFNDVDQASGYAISALQWACGAGILNGRADGILDPLGQAQRSELVAMLHRYALNMD